MHDHSQICNFCKKSKDVVEKLVAGPDVAICNECIELCVKAIDEHSLDEQDTSIDRAKKPITPKEIFSQLNRFVIGQESAKKILAIAVYNHYQRIRNIGSGTNMRKSNILMVGPTGSGKTMLVETLAKIMDVPIAISDATTLTESGYVGDDVENVVKKLLAMCDYDVERAEKGIIFIDEIDKISRRSENPSITRDVGGEGVQQSLLKLMEGTEITVPTRDSKRKTPGESTITVNTKNILFVCGGAFSGIEKIVGDKSEADTAKIGFGAEIKSKAQKKTIAEPLVVVQDDLVKFGLIPEFIGRLPVVAMLQELSSDDLVRVLSEPENSLVSEYQELFGLTGVSLEFQSDALKAIASLAIERKIGARGLRSILENLLQESMFDAPSQENLEKIVVTEECVTDKKQPIHVFKKAA